MQEFNFNVHSMNINETKETILTSALIICDIKNKTSIVSFLLSDKLPFSGIITCKIRFSMNAVSTLQVQRIIEVTL